METKILALDLGSVIGWATTKSFGSYRLPYKKSDPHTQLCIRLDKLERFISEQCKKHNIKSILVESPYYNKFGGVLRTIYYMHCIVEMFCWKNKIPYHSMTPSQARKIITSKGRLSKSEIIKFANKHLVKKYKNTIFNKVSNDHEADALVLLHAFIKKEEEKTKKIWK